MKWQKSSSPEGTSWHAQATDGAWEIQETEDAAIGIPPSGCAYLYPLVAGMLQENRSLAATQILAQEASLWAAAAYADEPSASTRSDAFGLICAGQLFEITREGETWKMVYEQDGASIEVESASPSALLQMLPEIFAGRSQQERQLFSMELDRARQRAILAEKHSDAVADTSMVRQLMSRASSTAASRIKSVEYALRSLRQTELRQMSLLAKMSSRSAMVA